MGRARSGDLGAYSLHILPIEKRWPDKNKSFGQVFGQIPGQGLGQDLGHGLDLVSEVMARTLAEALAKALAKASARAKPTRQGNFTEFQGAQAKARRKVRKTRER